MPIFRVTVTGGQTELTWVGDWINRAMAERDLRSAGWTILNIEELPMAAITKGADGPESSPVNPDDSVVEWRKKAALKGKDSSRRKRTRKRINAGGDPDPDIGDAIADAGGGDGGGSGGDGD